MNETQGKVEQPGGVYPGYSEKLVEDCAASLLRDGGKNSAELMKKMGLIPAKAEQPKE